MQKINYVLGYENLKIYQNDAWFQFSLDSILLPCFIKIKKGTRKILDIGSGNAIIPLVLTTRTNAQITGVEIQKEVYDLGKKSIILNKLEERIQLVCGDIKEYAKKSESDVFDIITCNPPYFKKEENSNLNIDIHKQYARHEILLKLEEVFQVARKLLKNNGSLYLVHRPERLLDLLQSARENHLEPKRIQIVYPKIGKEANILLLEVVKNGNPGIKILEPFYIYDEKGNYTEEMQKCFSKR